MTTSEQSIGLDDRIVSSVRECWDAHQMPLLLSRLGSQDNSEIAGRTKEQAGSLRAYLHQRLADRVRVIQHSDKPQLVGAVPADFAAGTTSEVDALLERTHNQRKESTQRFQPAFWAAFRKPLDEDKRRYVSVQKPVHFRDLHSEDELPDGFIEVERKHVIGPDAEPTEVQRQIRHWLADKDLESTSFLVKSEAGATHQMRLMSRGIRPRLIVLSLPKVSGGCVYFRKKPEIASRLHAFKPR